MHCSKSSYSSVTPVIQVERKMSAASSFPIKHYAKGICCTVLSSCLILVQKHMDNVKPNNAPRDEHCAKYERKESRNKQWTKRTALIRPKNG